MPDTPLQFESESRSASPENRPTEKTELGPPHAATTLTPFQPSGSALSNSSFPAPGTIVGVYRLDEKLGEGGMGAVWKAFHLKMEKHVALKVLPPEFTRNAKLLARFEREMRAVARIDHPNVVRGLDAGECDGLHFLVMEYVDGTDLARLVKDGGRQPVQAACALLRQAALGLAAAHKLGLVHRDIKPSNLFLTQPDKAAPGVVKILDLGLARLQDDASLGEKGAELTGSGTVMGTPDYMAPEQWDDTHRVDGRADLYALGCTLFFLLTGRAPFADEAHPSLLRKMAGHVSEPIPDLRTAWSRARGTQHASGVDDSGHACRGAIRPGNADESLPDAVVALYERLMAKKPEDRIQSADELATHLASIHAGDPALAATLAFTARPRTVRKTRIGLVAGAMAASLLVSAAILYWRDDFSPARIEVPEGGSITLVQEPAGDAASAVKGAVGWHGWPADTPKPAIAPFDAEQAKTHQDEWAAYLGVPVEYENPIGMRFRLIPPGEFLMGSTPQEIEETLEQIHPNDTDWQNCAKSEGPQHRVILTQPLYVGKYEVTQQDYFAVMETNPAHFTDTAPGSQTVSEKTARYPVENVNWSDAVDFCKRLSDREGSSPEAPETDTARRRPRYRLLREAEWEFASRAGSVARHWTGDARADVVRATWCGTNSRRRTHAVGELEANPFGLFDVYGNVWEFCQDAWAPDYFALFADSPAIDPEGPVNSPFARVMRGGDWHNPEWFCSSPSRLARPVYRGYDVGFRIALAVDAVQETWRPGQGTATPESRTPLNAP